MSEQSDNLRAESIKQAEQIGDDFIPEDAQPLCPRCLTPCHPQQYYCNNCDSNDAINPLTPYIGFLNIRFNYDIFLTMWRRIWYDEHTSIISRLFYLFMVTLFAPVIMIVGLPLLLISPQTRLRKVILITLFIVLFILLILFTRYGLFSGLSERTIH